MKQVIVITGRPEPFVTGTVNYDVIFHRKMLGNLGLRKKRGGALSVCKCASTCSRLPRFDQNLNTPANILGKVSYVSAWTS